MFKKTVASTKNFIADHRVGIAIVATFAATTVLASKIRNLSEEQHMDFLKEHNLLEEYAAQFED